MVSPLDVDVRERHDAVEDGVGTAAAVKEIANEMELRDGEALHERRERFEELRARIGLHDAREKPLLIRELRRIGIGPRRKEFDDDGAKALRDERREL